MPFCPICKSEEEVNNFKETYFSSYNNQEYKLYNCRKCELQWWEPRKIIPEFYEFEGEKSYAIFHLGVRKNIEENHKMFFEFFPIKSGRLLDIGCGDGVFLEHAKNLGFDVWGIDFDSKSIRVCQEKRGLENTFVKSLYEFARYCNSNNLKFDIITFFEVLEHQDDPVKFFDAVKSILNPGGWIAGSVPNSESILIKWNRRCFSGDFPPHHLLRFSQKSLENFMNFMNFKNHLVIPSSLVISEVPAHIQSITVGNKISCSLRKKICGSTIIEEGTYLYDSLPFWKKVFMKSLKIIRLFILIIPALIVKFLSSGKWLYFQAKSNNV